MEDLTKATNAFQVFQKYSDNKYPIVCYDPLIVKVDPTIVSAEDKALLEELGFSEEGDCFMLCRLES